MAKAVATKRAAARKPTGTSGVRKQAVTAKSPETKPAAKSAARKTSVVAKRPAKQAAQPVATAVDAQTLAHGLNSLLHTMQTVQQHEERLCSLMHALRRGRASRPLLGELREVLEQLPAHDYLHEVDALRDAVAS